MGIRLAWGPINKKVRRAVHIKNQNYGSGSGSESESESVPDPDPEFRL